MKTDFNKFNSLLLHLHKKPTDPHPKQKPDINQTITTIALAILKKRIIKPVIILNKIPAELLR